MKEQKIIDRETYRAIKKMSREELQAFLMRYADGLLEKDGKSIDLREVEKDFRQIKGIGDKRVEEIMAVFEKHLGVWEKKKALVALRGLSVVVLLRMEEAAVVTGTVMEVGLVFPVIKFLLKNNNKDVAFTDNDT